MSYISQSLAGSCRAIALGTRLSDNWWKFSKQDRQRIMSKIYTPKTSGYKK